MGVRINLLGEPEEGPRRGMYWFFGYVSSLVLLVAFLAFWSYEVSAAKSELEERLAQKEKQLAQIKEQTAEVDKLEEMQSELTDKISLIATLKKSKQGPVRVLDDLNIALPQLAWLDSIEERSQKMKLTGYALDNQTLAGFMTRLEESNYFEGIDLIQTSQSVRSGVRISAFTLQSNIHYAGQTINESADNPSNVEVNQQ